MRIVCWFICLALASGSLAFAQTAFKNGSNEWLMLSRVTGSQGELTGKIYAAPNSTVTISGGKITAGAGKFVSETGKKEIVACSVLADPLVDFVALEVSLLSWSMFGEPLEISLARPFVTYHLKADKSDNLVEVPLLASNTYPGYNILKKTDSTLLNEMAGKGDRTPNLAISFSVKAGESSPKRINMFLSYNACKVAIPAPSATTAPKVLTKK